MLKSLQNDTCSVFIYHSSFSYSHHYSPNQQFLSLLQPIFSSLFHLPACSQNHRYNLHEHSLLLCFICFSSPYFYILPCLKSPPKALSPTSANSDCQGFIEWASLVMIDEQGEQNSQMLIHYCTYSENWCIAGCNL